MSLVLRFSLLAMREPMASMEHHVWLIAVARRRNQTCITRKTTTPRASIADITENPMIYFGPSEEGNKYCCQLVT